MVSFSRTTAPLHTCTPHYRSDNRTSADPGVLVFTVPAAKRHHAESETGRQEEEEEEEEDWSWAGRHPSPPGQPLRCPLYSNPCCGCLVAQQRSEPLPCLPAFIAAADRNNADCHRLCLVIPPTPPTTQQHGSNSSSHCQLFPETVSKSGLSAMPGPCGSPNNSLHWFIFNLVQICGLCLVLLPYLLVFTPTAGCRVTGARRTAALQHSLQCSCRSGYNNQTGQCSEVLGYQDITLLTADQFRPGWLSHVSSLSTALHHLVRTV